MAERENVRGGRAVRYRYRPDAERRSPARAAADEVVLASVVGDEPQRRARQWDTRHRGHLTDAELWVDRDAWHAFREAVTAASLALHRAARPTAAPGTVHVSATVAAFRMRDDQ